MSVHFIRCICWRLPPRPRSRTENIFIVIIKSSPRTRRAVSLLTRRHGSQETGFYPSPTPSSGSSSLPSRERLAELNKMPRSRNSEFCIFKSKSGDKNHGSKSDWIAEYILLFESSYIPYWRKFRPLRKSRTIYINVSLVSKQGWRAQGSADWALSFVTALTCLHTLFTMITLGTEGKKSQLKCYICLFPSS